MLLAAGQSPVGSIQVPADRVPTRCAGAGCRSIGSVVQLVDGHPFDAGRLRAGGRLAGDVLGPVDDAELLAHLVVAGVVGDVPGIGEDPDHAGRPDGDAGLLEGLADGGLAE